MSRGSPALLFSSMTEPFPPQNSAIRIFWRPISTETSTGTSITNSSCPGCAGRSRARRHRDYEAEGGWLRSTVMDVSDLGRPTFSRCHRVSWRASALAEAILPSFIFRAEIGSRGELPAQRIGIPTISRRRPREPTRGVVAYRGARHRYAEESTFSDRWNRPSSATTSSGTSCIASRNRDSPWAPSPGPLLARRSFERFCFAK